MADLVWYVSYGSNMHRDRLDCYLAGGQPPGGARTYPGCRDTTPPRDGRGMWLPGSIYFATHSPVWGGGRALYDPTLDGHAAARGWLVTPSQFSDIAAQEMYRQPGADLDLEEVLATGRVEYGPGRYETLLHTGNVDDIPVLTFTAPHTAADVEPLAPSAAYLRMLAGGLTAGHGWTPTQAADYLAALPGAAGHWTVDSLLTALG